MENVNCSIGLFIDGGYYAKVNEALAAQASLNIDMGSLIYFVRRQIARIGGHTVSDCHVTESHYFRGRYRVRDANNKHLLYKERQFEDALIENDVIFHYKHLREVQQHSGGTTVIEKGIDVWFALEAYELSVIRKFDYVVLITGDADHEMLIRKLKALKIRAVLLTWDVDSESSATSRLLKDEACLHIELSELVAADSELLGQLCRRVKGE